MGGWAGQRLGLRRGPYGFQERWGLPLCGMMVILKDHDK
jgi:hypothetical protein